MLPEEEQTLSSDMNGHCQHYLIREITYWKTICYLFKTQKANSVRTRKQTNVTRCWVQPPHCGIRFPPFKQCIIFKCEIQHCKSSQAHLNFFPSVLEISLSSCILHACHYLGGFLWAVLPWSCWNTLADWPAWCCAHPFASPCMWLGPGMAMPGVGGRECFWIEVLQRAECHWFVQLF